MQQQPPRVREQALVASSRSSGGGRAKAPTGTATAVSTRSRIDMIKSPPSSNNNAPQQRVPDASADSRSRRVASTAAASGTNAALKKKVDDVFKRMQPHTIVQAYEKLLGGLKIAPTLAVNGEVLPPLAAAPALAVGWKAAAKRETAPEVLPGAFNPPSGQFRYARCLQFAPSDPTLSLATLKTLHVSFTSAINRSTATTLLSPRTPATLTKKAWRLVAEAANQQLGLALYELSLESWQQSSLVALVWSQSLEVVKLYLQLNVAELLYACVQRQIRIPADDVDASHGLHSYVVAVSIRTFERVLWEKEFYGVELSASAPHSSGPTAPAASAHLLDNAGNVYRDRERYLSSPDAALPVATDALAFAMDTVLVVDVGVWEGSTCAPVWGFSKLLSITRPPPGAVVSRAPDFSLSDRADNTLSFALRHDDASSGNALSIALEKLSSNLDAAKKQTRVFVKQVDVTLSLRFVDATFGTSYARATQR
ncbi:hypothetical protein PybrP1_011992 [[Pythium] brassicae (nom. inval.)]|nr:hypothetical protein PybrP1_011992 [[Pythium] brassicae (nom. inval.)]